jgi:acetolactate synthase small subunit
MKNEMEQVLAELAAITARFEAMVDDVEKTTETFIIECRADRKKYSESMKKVLA